MPTMTGAHIAADRLTFALPDGRALFNDLTLAFGRERTGLVGPNGSGKTTLLRLLSGELTPQAGTVHRAGVVAMLPQQLSAAPDATLAAVLQIDTRLAALRRSEAGIATADDLDLIGDGWDLPERAAAVLGRFGLGHLQLDMPVGAVSGGEGTRVALAGLALGNPDVLLLDEPTNHLDAPSREALYAFVEEWSAGVVCVSHDRALLRRMDRIVELPAGRLYGGGYDGYRTQRELEDAAAARELDSARAALRVAERESRAVRERQSRRDARGKRGRATANMPKILLNARRGQAEATTARIRAITEREVEERRARARSARERVEERERPRFALAPTALPARRTVLELNGVQVHFPDAAHPLLDGISLRITGPERVGLAGPNGSGKSTLLRVAMGRLEPSGGVVRHIPLDEMAFLDQQGAALDPRRTVLENFRAFHPEFDDTWGRAVLARFLFSDEAALQTVGTLSGGQALRASLACTLGGVRPPCLLVLDEPTNHLDLDALEALEEALRAYDGAVLVASHDTAFLEAIKVERVVELPLRRASTETWR